MNAQFRNLNLTLPEKSGPGFPLSYTWTDPKGDTVSETDRVLLASNLEGHYRVRVDDGCSAPVYDSVPISFFTIPQAYFTADTVNRCSPFSLHLTDNSLDHDPTRNTWIIGNQRYSDSGDFVHTFPTGGKYRIGLVSISGASCLDSIFFPDSLTVYQKPEARFKIEPNKQLQKTLFKVSNESRGADHHLWDYARGWYEEFNGKDTMISLVDTGFRPIVLIAISQFNCRDTAIDSIRIVEPKELYIPNAFTPDDNNTINPTFSPYTHGIASYELLIFDRWGEEILHCTNCSWDGTYEGRLSPQDVYLYVIRYVSEMDEQGIESGTVTLLR